MYFPLTAVWTTKTATQKLARKAANYDYWDLYNHKACINEVEWNKKK